MAFGAKEASVLRATAVLATALLILAGPFVVFGTQANDGGTSNAPSRQTGPRDSRALPIDIHPYTKGDVTNIPRFPASTASEPAKGGSYYDANYKVTMTKAADSKQFPQAESQGVTRPVYSRWRIDNSAGDLYFLVKGGETPPTNGTGQMVFFKTTDNSVYRIASDIDGLETSEFRWDYSGKKPNSMYYVDGTMFREYNVTNGQSSRVHDFAVDFPGGARILNDVEGDSSMDSRYWAWMVQGPYNGDVFPMIAIITYDKAADKVPGVLDYAKFKAMGGAGTELPRPNMVDMSVP
jgi:hypothetical protein